MLEYESLVRRNTEHLSYLRHKKGSGRIFDGSEACERSVLDRTSEISGKTSIWQSKIIDSCVVDSVVSDAVIKHSWVHNSDVRGGIIMDSVVACELVAGNVRITDSQVLGKARIAHAAVLRNVRVRDLTVKGNAQLLDWPDEVFDGCQGYVARGVWTRPPRVVRLSFGVTVTESTDDQAFVGCKEYPIHYWFLIGDRIGRARGWDTRKVDAVRRILESWITHPIPV
jgi:hypothetical protein